MPQERTRSISESQRKANVEWNAKHYKQLSCKVQLETGKAFQEICEKSGITANTALVSVVEKCIDDPEAFGMILQWAKERPVKPFRPKSRAEDSEEG